MTTLIHQETHPNAQHTVYAHRVEFVPHTGRVTPANWHHALAALERTPQARAAMRDVEEWLAANTPAPDLVKPKREKGCEACGADISDKPHNRKLCDICRDCREKERERMQNAKRTEPKAPTPCLACGNEFLPKRKGNTLCSHECRLAYKRVGFWTQARREEASK